MESGGERRKENEKSQNRGMIDRLREWKEEINVNEEKWEIFKGFERKSYRYRYRYRQKGKENMQVYSVQTYYKFKEKNRGENTEFEESSDAEVKRQRLSENKVERLIEE